MSQKQRNVRRVAWLCGIAVLMLISETASAQFANSLGGGAVPDTAESPAQPDALGESMAVTEVDAQLLLLKADWSQGPTAEQVEADIRELLAKASRSQVAERSLRGGAASLLFPHALVTVYREADFENLLAWMRQHGLVQQRIPFSLVEPPPGVSRQLGLKVDTAQVPIPIKVASQVPDLVRRVDYLWEFGASMLYGGFPTSAMGGAGSRGGEMSSAGTPEVGLGGTPGMSGLLGGGMGGFGMDGFDPALVRVQRHLRERESTTFPIESVLREQVVYSATADFRVLPDEVAVLPWYFRAEESGLRQWVHEQGVDPFLVLRTQRRLLSDTKPNQPNEPTVEDSASPAKQSGRSEAPPTVGPLRLPIRIAVPRIVRVKDIEQDLLAFTTGAEQTTQPLAEQTGDPVAEMPPSLGPQVDRGSSDMEIGGAGTEEPPVTDAELDAARGRFAAAEQLTFDLAARARSLPDNSTESQAMRERLQAAVRSAFDLRMDLQKMEARGLRQQLRQVTANLARRQQMADAITDNRVRELLTSPDLHWPRESSIDPLRSKLSRVAGPSAGRLTLESGPSGTTIAGGSSVPASPAEALYVRQHRETVRRLEAIMLAMHKYYGQQQHFPPAVIFGRDGRGKVPHSWRVALLPLLGESDLYDEYNFDEPWDGPHNRALLSRMPLVYRSPRDADSSTNASVFGLVTSPTSQLAWRRGIAGLETVFSQPAGAQMRQIQDGSSNTVAIVEAKRDIPWTKPEDILVFTPGQPLTGQFGGWFQEGWHAGFADGKAKWISNASDEADVRALLTIAGRETVELTLVPAPGEPGQVGSGP